MDIILNANSCGKPRAQRMQPVRLTEYLKSKITKSDVKNNVRERAQPVRIAELLGPLNNVNSIKKRHTSERKKKVQPERLLAIYTNVRKPNPTERHGRTICPLTLSAKSVRRTLKFNDGPASQTKTVGEPKTLTKKEDNRSAQNSTKKGSCTSTVKKTDVQRSKSQMIRRYSKIPQISKSQKVVRNISKDFHSVAKMRENKSIAACAPDTIIQESESPVEQIGKPKVLQKTNVSGEKQLHNSRIDTEKRQTKSTYISSKSLQKCSTNAWTTVKRMESLMRTSSIDDLCLTQETSPAQISPPNETPVTLNNPVLNISKSPCLDNDSDIIHIRKDEFLCLKETLETLVQRTEEDLFKLKSVLSHIAQLSGTSETKAETPTTKGMRERKHSLPSIVPSIIHKNMEDKEVQVGLCCNLEGSPSSSASVSKLQTIKVSEPDSNDVDADKENKRSKSMPANDSFLKMEEELQIKHAQELPTEKPEQQATPALRRSRRNSTRSLREYIALKSNIRFLKTPDTKAFKCLRDDDPDRLSAQKHISIKLLSDLQNLYADSPSSVSQTVYS